MFKTILFDIDGVMLSEERYFDASALTVFEILCSPHYLDCSAHALPSVQPVYSDAEIGRIRQAVFANETVLETMKQRGVNANWDMVFLQVAYQIARLFESLGASTLDLAPYTAIVADGWSQTTLRRIREQLHHDHAVAPALDFSAFNAAFAQARNKAQMFEVVEARFAAVLGSTTVAPQIRTLWEVCQHVFQEWYLGETYVPSSVQPGKQGFLSDEVPLVPPHKLAALFASCRAHGIVIGIGTGRPRIETEVPLEHFGWLDVFDRTRISTASEVLHAQHAHPNLGPLSKPHPYSYLRSLLATDNVEQVLAYPLPLADEVGSCVLVVGDSVADALAAKALGCRFAAVLTGLEGHKARSQFESLAADYIFDDVLGLQQLLESHG